MSTVKLHCFIFGILLQILINTANGKPLCPGECDPCYESRFECGSAPAIVPIPQPVPVRVPQRERCPSVTIPNIIVALLPPNEKRVVPRPVIRTPPVVLPLPHHSPFSSFPGLGGFGGFGGYGGYGGFGGYGGGFGEGFRRFEGCGCL